MTYGKSHGQCNICGGLGKLTFDHIPPRGCLPPSVTLLVHASQALGAESLRADGVRYMQDGVKYRTLCGPCNNRLGHDHDPEFIRFTQVVSNYLGTVTPLPSTTTASVKPQRLLRSVLGHLCALGVERYFKGPITEPIKDYLGDPSHSLPSALRAYYWLYPHRTFTALRDVAMADFGAGVKPCAFWLLKFFPVAVMFTIDEPEGWSFRVGSFEPWRSVGIDEVVELPLQLRPVIHQYWPEAPTENGALVYGEAAVMAGMPVQRRERRLFR